jgi:sialidase-1
VLDQTTGVVWLLMTWNLGSDTEAAITRGTSKATRRVFITRSTDDGNTWAKPTDITAAVKRAGWHWYATGPVNGIQLTRGPHHGRLIVPANHSELIDGRVITRSHIIFSDDHGATWQPGGSEEEKTNESTIVELADGRLLHNMRSYHQKNRRAVATSSDGGVTWSPVTLDERLIEPVCQASLLRAAWPVATNRGAILFCNPASLKRENLAVRVSHDEGQTWSSDKVIHLGPAAYSCLAVLPDQTFCCLYECGERQPYEKISLARFSLPWIEQP